MTLRLKLTDLGATRQEIDSASDLLQKHLGSGGPAATDLLAIVVLFGRSEKAKRAVRRLELLADHLRLDSEVAPATLAAALNDAIAELK